MTFVPLLVYSEFSLPHSVVRIDELCRKAKEAGLKALALTDQGHFFAALKFFKSCKAHGLKPILGVTLEVVRERTTPFKVQFYCQNVEGYQNLSAIISASYLTMPRAEAPLIPFEYLQQQNWNGVLAIGAGPDSDVVQALLAGRDAMAAEYLQEWQGMFPDRFYVGLQSVDAPYVPALTQLAYDQQLACVAMHAIHFLEAEDYMCYMARIAIGRGTLLETERTHHLHQEQQYFLSPEAFAQKFAAVPMAIENTIAIAKKCNFKFEFGNTYLPDFPIPADQTLKTYFTQQATLGLQLRLQQEKHLQKISAEELTQYQQRLEEECSMIDKMGFAGYFLIVSDLIQWAKQQDIPVGPGRGSGAGSLVAYALQITDIDPMVFRLLFERFLNPERVSMPDFDIDFCMDGRDRVIEYVTNRYGRTNVSQIATFGTMAAKAVVRDVGRILGYAYGFVDKVAKLIPFDLGITLEKALELEPRLKEWYQEEEEVRHIIDLALKLEGLTRSVGKHAGGMVIAPRPLTEFVPIYCEENSQQIVSQFDKDDVEAIGLVKFDFLGLRTLTLIQGTCKKIIQTSGMADWHLRQIDLEDPDTYRLLKNGQTTAIFQLESRGMKDLIARLVPDCFEEIVALVALFRPGPLQSGMVDDFINRKHGRAAVTYPHPCLEKLLEPTYGVILYQEQVMQIAQELAGYSLGEADLLRRAMGKKKPEEMAQQRDLFITGAKRKHDIDPSVANPIFDLMEKFAGYGFNKSHAAAYALISYQTAWLKTHYPVEFMAAVLSSDMMHTDKVVYFLQECRKMHIEVLPPSVAESTFDFQVTADKKICYGLGAIKGVGEGAVENIVHIRQDRPFTTLEDFLNRIDHRKCHKRVLEALIGAGAMDAFGERAFMLHHLEGLLRIAIQQEKFAQQGQTSLFSQFTGETAPLSPVRPWSLEEKLKIEKTTLGFYLSGHPFMALPARTRAWRTAALEKLPMDRPGMIKLMGFISGARFITTKTGNKMAWLVLEDESGTQEVAVFSDLLEQQREVFVKDNLVFIEAAIQRVDKDKAPRMRVQSLCGLDEWQAKSTKLLKIHLKPFHKPHLAELKALLCTPSTTPGDITCPVEVYYADDTTHVKIRMPEHAHAQLSKTWLTRVKELIGIPHLEFVGQ